MFMKQPNKIILLAFLFACCCLHAQSASSNEKALEKTVNELYKGMVNKEKKTLERLTLEGLTYGHSSGTIENKSAYVKAVMTGPFEFLSIDPADQTMTIFENTAIVRHIFNAKGKNDGEATDVHIGVMMTFEKVKSQYKLLARQAYKL